MILKSICSFTFGNCKFDEYLCEEIGIALPLHSHTFNHLTKVIKGEIEVFTDDGRSSIGHVGDAPFEYNAGTMHGIRALTPGTIFMNISPYLEE